MTTDSRIGMFPVFHNLSLQNGTKNLWNAVMNNLKIKDVFSLRASNILYQNERNEMKVPK